MLSLVALVTSLDTWFSLQLVLLQLRSGKSVLIYSGFSGIPPFPPPCVFAAVEWEHRDVLIPQVELRQGLIQVLQGGHVSIGRVTYRSADGTALRNILDLELIGCDN